MSVGKFDSYHKVYWLLVVLRITLVFIPQSGFIHPDEFFQSVEVLAGKFLDVESSLPWEFNSTMPIRSMAIPYFTIGMSFKLLRNFNNLANQYLEQIFITPYTMLVIPRFLMCLCSFLVDFCLYRICFNNNENTNHDSFRNCFIISFVTVLGLFNRPTFVAFAVIPIFFWLYRGIGTKSVTVLQFHSRLLIFVICSVPTLVLIVLIDSFYYGYITWGEIGMLDVSINNFVFTPLNFVKYNLNLENLAKHGLHPRFLHMVVNVPLLFNVLGLSSLFTYLKYAYMCFFRKFHLLPSVRSIKCLMALSFVTPLVSLSLFQHQEPRFLIPLLIPLIYLHGPTILPEIQEAVVEAPKMQLVQPKNKKHSYALLKVWFVINTLLMIFYGFIHQGGVYYATEYISQNLRATPLTTEFHIVTSHLYSIPQSFLLQRPSSKLFKKGKSQYLISRRVFLYEEGSKELSLILKQLQITVEANHNKFKDKVGRFKVYLLISSSLADQLNYLIGKQFLNFYLVETFYPHLSIEAFPDFTSYCLNITAYFYKSNCTVLSFGPYFLNIFKSIGLNLYEVTLNNI